MSQVLKFKAQKIQNRNTGMLEMFNSTISCKDTYFYATHWKK